MQKENIIPTEIFNDYRLFASAVLHDTSQNETSLRAIYAQRRSRGSKWSQQELQKCNRKSLWDHLTLMQLPPVATQMPKYIGFTIKTNCPENTEMFIFKAGNFAPGKQFSEW